MIKRVYWLSFASLSYPVNALSRGHHFVLLNTRLLCVQRADCKSSQLVVQRYSAVTVFTESERISARLWLQMEREQSEFCNLKSSQYTERELGTQKHSKRNTDTVKMGPFVQYLQYIKYTYMLIILSCVYYIYP